MSEGFVSLASAVIKYANMSYLYKGRLTCLMVAALAGHHELVKQILGSPGTDIDAVDETGQSALAKACVRGHLRVAMTLLGSEANLQLRDRGGRDCLKLAQLYKQRDLLRLLQHRLKLKSTPEQPEILQSPGNLTRGESLSRILSSAGFTRERAKQQQRLADFLETLAGIITKDGRSMTGSYADGWGNSLKQVNGLTAADSDIDWTVIVGLQEEDEDKNMQLVFHLEGSCRCGEAKTLSIIDGHAQIQSPAGSQPAVAADACGVRPAEDTCHAYQCCGSLTHPKRVQKLLPAGASAMKVHLVTATRPNSDNEMRVSFSFHEKETMRGLSETQGQLFVLIKFIFKRLLPRVYHLSGLKTYHARTLMFFILHTFPSDAWSRENLRSLLAKALNTMIELMEAKGCTDICMPHFFIPGAFLYVKNAGIGGPFLKSKVEILEKLIEIKNNIEIVERHLLETVSPLESDVFHFHPFALLPLTVPPDEEEVKQDKFAHIYCIVFEILGELRSEIWDKEALLSQAERLPDCCMMAKLCLMAMAHLKSKDESTAKQLLQRQIQLKVLRSLSPENVRHLDEITSDWLWRFCFIHHNLPEMEFLPEFSRSLICVKRPERGPTHLYVNFRCLWWSLGAELLADSRKSQTDSWFQELQDSPGSEDFEELRTLTEFSDSQNHVNFCLERARKLKDEKRLQTTDDVHFTRMMQRQSSPHLQVGAQQKMPIFDHIVWILLAVSVCFYFCFHLDTIRMFVSPVVNSPHHAMNTLVQLWHLADEFRFLSFCKNLLCIVSFSVHLFNILRRR
ncbi:hypothetical protein BOX15_Mlig015886g1 [Macrostomum lignano]|uniref:Uncharacterized protein n=1 Tax=Macrostomum lignano TaxID=282301 RepID=A0A267DDE9_9PLAT|nr:hypothetical protein BOX15_Mlig015886g1 [Macrostomum lignano]